MCLPNILFPVFTFAFNFHCCSFSPCWRLAFLIFSPPPWISMFFFLRNSSPLLSITRASSFSVIHVSVNIKNNAEKDTTLLLFFFLKVRADIWFPTWYACGVDGRSGGRAVYGHVITKFSQMGRLPHFLSCGAPPTRWAPLIQGIQVFYDKAWISDISSSRVLPQRRLNRRAVDLIKAIQWPLYSFALILSPPKWYT